MRLTSQRIMLMFISGSARHARDRRIAAQSVKKPNIVIIWGDDIGQSNISAYSDGLMGYRTPNIDRIAREGMKFTDYYGEQSCTAGRPRSSRASTACAPA